MAQKYYVVYGEDSEDGSPLHFMCEGLEELLLNLSDLARELPDAETAAEWLGSFFVFPSGTSAEKATAECAHFIIEGEPGNADPVFPEENEIDE